MGSAFNPRGDEYSRGGPNALTCTIIEGDSYEMGSHAERGLEFSKQCLLTSAYFGHPRIVKRVLELNDSYCFSDNHL